MIDILQIYINMDDNTNDNRIVDNDNENQELEFHYNFINIPWDDRTKGSKVSIVALLVAIFVVTMACVIQNFVLHYRGFSGIKNYNNTEISCYRVKMNEYPFAARIHSVASQELLCVCAVVSSTSVLANGVCVKSGPIRMYLGSPTNRRCKKGFPVDLIESMYHDGSVSKKLVLLSSYENIDKCSEVIPIGQKLDWNSPVHIIGRPLGPGLFLTRQHANLVGKEFLNSRLSIRNLNLNHTICVKDLAKCPVRAGDLLLQNGQLFGVASTSVRRNKIACFADLNIVKNELKELDTDIEVGLFASI